MEALVSLDLGENLGEMQKFQVEEILVTREELSLFSSVLLIPRGFSSFWRLTMRS